MMEIEETISYVSGIVDTTKALVGKGIDCGNFPEITYEITSACLSALITMKAQVEKREQETVKELTSRINDLENKVKQYE